MLVLAIFSPNYSKIDIANSFAMYTVCTTAEVWSISYPLSLSCRLPSLQSYSSALSCTFNDYHLHFVSIINETTNGQIHCHNSNNNELAQIKCIGLNPKDRHEKCILQQFTIRRQTDIALIVLFYFHNANYDKYLSVNIQFKTDSHII